MRRLWTKEEDALFLALYPDMPTVELAERLQRSYCSVSARASLMQISKSTAFFQSAASGRINANNDIGQKTRFSKNAPGWNKGMKQKDYMSPEMIERTRINQFKKGQDPHNTVAIGSERVTVDGYIEVKVRHCKNGEGKNKNFELKQRLVYAQHYGLIPENMLVIFKDGNSLNVAIENLDLRSKAENMLFNSYSDNGIVKRFMGIKKPEIVERIKNEMPELITMKRNEILLNQKINKKDAK